MRARAAPVILMGAWDARVAAAATGEKVDQALWRRQPDGDRRWRFQVVFAPVPSSRTSIIIVQFQERINNLVGHHVRVGRTPLPDAPLVVAGATLPPAAIAIARSLLRTLALPHELLTLFLLRLPCLLVSKERLFVGIPQADIMTLRPWTQPWRHGRDPRVGRAGRHAKEGMEGRKNAGQSTIICCGSARALLREKKGARHRDWTCFAGRTELGGGEQAGWRDKRAI